MPEVGIKFKLDNTTLKNSLKEATSSLQKFNRENQVKEKNLKNLMKLEATSNNAKQKNILLMEKEIRLLKTQTAEYGRMSTKMKNFATPNKVYGSTIGRAGGVGMGVMGGIGGALASIGTIYAGARTIQGSANRQAEWTQISNALGGDVSSATKSDIQNIAMQTGQSNVDVIRAFYDALSSAFTEEASKAITKTSATVATALGGNIVDTQDIIISTAKAYGITDQKGIENIGNLLSGTVKASRGTIGEIAQNAGQFMPFSSQYGIGLEDTLAAFSAITLKVGNVAESATALKNFFTQINQGNDTLTKYGITGASLRDEGLQKTLDKLSNVLDKDKNLFDELFPNIRAGLAGASLIDKGVLQNSKDIIATGNISQEFGRAGDDANVQIVRMKNAFETLSDTFLETTGILNDVTDGLSGLTDVMIGLSNLDLKKIGIGLLNSFAPIGNALGIDNLFNSVSEFAGAKQKEKEASRQLDILQLRNSNSKGINGILSISEMKSEQKDSQGIRTIDTDEFKNRVLIGMTGGTRMFFDNLSYGMDSVVKSIKSKVENISTSSSSNNSGFIGPKNKQFNQ